MGAYLADKWRRDYRDATSLHSSGVRRQARASRFCGREWNENRIKQPTGGDPLTARFMRQDLFTFMPTHKLFIFGNNQPNLTKVDDAARRRFQMIPSEDHRPDKQLRENFAASIVPFCAG